METLMVEVYNNLKREIESKGDTPELKKRLAYYEKVMTIRYRKLMQDIENLNTIIDGC
jgi:ribosomal protein S21